MPITFYIIRIVIDPLSVPHSYPSPHLPSFAVSLVQFTLQVIGNLLYEFRLSLAILAGSGPKFREEPRVSVLARLLILSNAPPLLLHPESPNVPSGLSRHHGCSYGIN